MRRKGELSSAAIDHGWPHQVVLPARLCERDGYNEIHEFCRDLTLCSRGHALLSRRPVVSRLLLQGASGRAKVHGEIWWREVRSYRARPRRQLGEVEKRLAPAAPRAATRHLTRYPCKR